MSKFKKGDRVVVRFVESYEDVLYDHEIIVGNSYNILRDPFLSGEYWYGLTFNRNMPEECLELESVYNSPLYKALS